MKLSLEDQNLINKYRCHIAWLKTVGDDQSIQQEKREFYSRINSIKDKYKIPVELMTPEQTKQWLERQRKVAERDLRAYRKRSKISNDKKKVARELLKTITPKQEAINKICDINYHIKMTLNHPCRVDTAAIKRLSNKRHKIMQQWNLKSTDIRRQKKFDKKYV